MVVSLHQGILFLLFWNSSLIAGTRIRFGNLGAAFIIMVIWITCFIVVRQVNGLETMQSMVHEISFTENLVSLGLRPIFHISEQ